MKILKIVLVAVICAAICFAVITSCSDYLNHAPKEISDLHEIGESVNVNGSYFDVEQSFKPSGKKDGYISDIAVSVKVTGYDADFTYFGSSLSITWAYGEITDEHPMGIEREFSTTLELNASGNGEYTHTIPLDSCRSVYDIKVDYTWSGTATRI